MSSILASLAVVSCAAARVPADLREPWLAYLRVYVQADGRVMDPATQMGSTSEGQAYAMLRALWMDDRESFERLRIWTRDNLQGGDETKLPAWKWGLAKDGSWGVLDAQSAADADVWMAWVLLVGARQWGIDGYRDQALALAARIWEEETTLIAGKRVLVPGRWARDADPVRLNPSYWLPFAWRELAAVDSEHPWGQLVASAYELWARTSMPSGLPPDWVWVDRSTGQRVPPPPGEEAQEDFGFEAFRIAWTLAAEVRWWSEPRAVALLEPFAALEPRWRAAGQLPGVLRPDGTQRVEWEYPGMYGALLPAWAVGDPVAANALYRKEIRPRRGAHGWGEERDYYGQNWVWLGVALWRDLPGPGRPTP